MAPNDFIPIIFLCVCALGLIAPSSWFKPFHPSVSCTRTYFILPPIIKKCHLERFAPSSQVAEGCTLPLRSVAAGSDPYCNCVGAGSIGKVW